MSDELFDIGLQAVSLTADLPDPIITVSGANSYAVDNTADYPLLGLNLYGKSTQNGTPTPTTPVDIVSVGDSGSINVKSCGKNLLNYDAWKTVKTNNGTAIFENNGVTITATKNDAYTHFTLINGFPDLARVFVIEGETITLSWEESTNTSGLVYIFPNGKLDGYVNCNNSRQKKLTYTVSSGVSFITFRFGVSLAGDTISYKNIMIERGSEATIYEPYKGSTASITTALPLCGIPVDSGGNYTDNSGQQWVCDELVYNADGTGKIIKHIGSYTISSNSDVHLMENTGVYRRFSIWNIPHKNMSMSAPCTAYKYQSGFEFNSGDIDSYANCFVLVNSTARFVSNATTVDEFIVANTGVKFTYPLAEPQEIELSAAEMAELKTLQSYDSVTNVYNNSGADMTVKILRRDYDMQYVFWIEESQTWVCPIGGKWKIICVGGGASGGQQHGTGAVLYGAGGTTSFGSILAADGGTAADKVTTTSAASGQCGYDGLTYGWAPSANIIGAGTNSQAHGYGAGGAATSLNLRLTGTSSDKSTKTASGLCGKIKSTVVDIAENQSIICTVGDGGVLDITDSALKQYLMAADTTITDVATTAAEFTAAAGKGKKGVIIAQYLGY